MAVYTVELGELVRRKYPLALNNYPIFDEAHREVLNSKIINHYYFREICCDSPSRFNFYLSTKMNEIMSFYNQLYKSELIEFNPLTTDAYSENNTLTKNGEKALKNTSKTTGEENSKDTYGAGKHETLKEENTRDLKGSENSTLTRTDDLTETEEKSGSTSKSAVAKNVSTTTNDLNTINTTTNSGKGSNTTRGNKVTGFSDIPQSGTTTSVTTNPDGSVTAETTGYLTTRTTETTNEQNNTTTEEKGNSTTTNAGTVDVNSSVEQSDETTTSDSSTTSNTGTQTSENTAASTESESGTITNDNKTDEYSTRSVDTSSKNSGEKEEQETRTDKENGVLIAEGRRGVSPAELIKKYREILQNIDMMIIDELNDLFMGVY